MRRATLKVSPTTADRLAKNKPLLSVEAGRNLTTGDAIDYLLKYWLDAHGQSKRYIIGPDGVAYGPFDGQA